MRKCLKWVYLSVITIIIGTVFILGCDGGCGGDNHTDGGGGHRESRCSYANINTLDQCDDLAIGHNCRGPGNVWSQTYRTCTLYDCRECY